jgi:glycosyltransferase involved in cell wall biosynthesis
MNQPDLMVFEPNLGGHHAEFTTHILRHWLNSEAEGRLLAAIAPGLLEQQTVLSEGIINPPRTSTVALQGALPGASKGQWAKGRSNLKLLSDAIVRHRPKQVLVMYLDHAQLALALSLRFPFPVTISGILFHPTLHYGAGSATGLRSRLQRLRKQLLLRLIARNPHLGTVFTLDPSAVVSLRRLGLNAVALPDPVVQHGNEIRSREDMLRSYGIEANRKVLLLFGALTARKGVIPLLQALALLPPRAAREVTLFMAGPLDESLQMQTSVLASRARTAGAQVVHHNELIQNRAVQSFMGSADLVLAPYQRHFGSSAVLIRAALAERPVLSQSFGLMGQYVREHGLGQAVETGDPAAISEGILAFLRDPGTGFDPALSQRFVRSNTPELFCKTIFSNLFPELGRVPQLAYQS